MTCGKCCAGALQREGAHRERVADSTVGAIGVVDLLIRNGYIIDGNGTPPFRSDLAIEGDRIVDVGIVEHGEARRMIDAGGKMVTPGFIDIHTHNDLYVTRNNLGGVFEPFVRQGITTSITGNCGWGIAPFTGENGTLYRDTVGGLGITLSDPPWSSMDEFLSYVDRKGPVINMAHLVPHGPLRMIAMGEKNTFSTAPELEKMKSLLAEAMEAGCFGFSTGLMYYPGIYSHTDELIELNKVCGRYGGRYATHLRAQCTTFPYAVREAVEIAREGGTGLQISHFHAKPFFGNKAALFYHLVDLIEAVNRVIPLPRFPNKALDEGLAIVNGALDEGADIGMDMIAYIISNTTTMALFPPWTHVGGSARFLQRLSDDKTWSEIKKDMQTVIPEWPPWGERSWSDNYSKALGWNIIRILSVRSEKNRPLVGKSMVEIARERKSDPWEVAREITIEEGGGVTITAGFPPRPWVEKVFSFLLAHPQLSVMCDALIPENGLPPQTAYGTFPRFLGHFVRDLRLVSLPEAIRKITSLPARRFGIEKRGEIQKGYAADIVVFDANTIADRSTPEKPNRFPVGIDAVVINGAVVLQGDSYISGINAGRVLRKS